MSWSHPAVRGAHEAVVDCGGPLHYVHFGGPAGAPLVVLVHGFDGSFVDWLPLVPLLRARFRVVAVDFPGSGLSPLAGRKASISAEAETLGRFVREFLCEPVILMGHSAGGLVSLTETVRRSDGVRGVVLVNTTQPLGLRGDVRILVALTLSFVPGLVERFFAGRRARVPVETRVREGLAELFPKPFTVSDDVLEAVVALRAHQDATAATEVDAALAQLARSLVRTFARPRRFRRMLSSVSLPVLSMHGAKDTVIPVAWAERTARNNPEWTFSVILGAGHSPQLTHAQRMVELVGDWFDREVADLAGASYP